MNETLTAVSGLEVGHWTHQEAATGCTVVLCPPEGCVASGLALGGAPATRESSLLAPEKMMGRIDAVVLSGGSAFGLSAADGVVRWLAEQGRGFETRAGPVPIVVGASIYDLEVGRAEVRPDARAGYAASQAATSSPVVPGRIGAAAGASAGAYAGYDKAVPVGLGSHAVTFKGATVAALVVSNPAGDLYDPATGELLAGQGLTASEIASCLTGYKPRTNTTLVVVATDAPLAKADAAALCISAHVGVAQVTHPSHTIFDGDMAYVLSTGRGPAIELGSLCVLVQEVVVKAIVKAARDKG
jgi:L-aminopeptidase/D-esterase-like protein